MKTHRGVNGSFQRLVQNDPAFDLETRRFLSRGYDLKARADYGTGPESLVPVEVAREALAYAVRSMASCEAVLAGT